MFTIQNNHSDDLKSRKIFPGLEPEDPQREALRKNYIQTTTELDDLLAENDGVEDDETRRLSQQREIIGEQLRSHQVKPNQVSAERVKVNSVALYLQLSNKTRKFKIGEIDRDSQTFRTIPRSHKNLFRVFNNGLGVNEEVLDRYLFDFIEVPFNGEILRTTKKHFLAKSIPSPYVSKKVDKQRILPIKEFYIPEEPEDEKEDQQLSMWG